MARGDRAAYKAQQQAKRAAKAESNKVLTSSKPRKEVSVTSSDFKSFLEVDNVYLHSSTDTFMNSFQKNVGKFPFQELLDVIKSELFAMIQEDIDNFRSMENTLVNQIKAKYSNSDVKVPFNDREGYLKYLNEFRQEVSENPKTGYRAYDLIQFKKVAIDSKKITKEVFEVVRKLSVQKTAKSKLLSKKDLSSGSAKNLQKILDEEERIIKMDAKTKREITQELEDIIKKYENQINSFAKDLSKFLSSVILTAESIYDPHTNTSEFADRGLDIGTEQKTASKKIIDLLKSLGVQPYKQKDNVFLKKSAEELYKEITDSVNKIGPLNFIATFYNDIARDWFQYTVDSFQTDASLGFLFEPAIADVIINSLTSKDSPFLSLGLEGGDVKGVGQIAALRSSSPLDVQTAAFSHSGQAVNIGLSIKLKEAKSDIKLENTPVDKYWEFINNTLGRTDDKMFAYEYMRANMLALDSYSVRGDLDFKYTGEQFLEFEKEIITIASLTRLMVGLYEKIENQYRTVGMSTNQLYYTAYLYGLDHVLSTADVLEGVLKNLENGKKLFTTSFSNIKSIQQPTEKQMKDLYEAKLEVVRSIGKDKVLYSTIYSDDDVKRLMSSINSMLMRYSMKGAKSSVSMTPAKMKEAMDSI